LPQAPVSPAGSDYPAPSSPPTAAFVPPELLARRRAAAPPSTPYQPIAGWSLAPAQSMEPPATEPHGFNQAPPPSAPPPTGPINGFAGAVPGGQGSAGPASVLQAPGPPPRNVVTPSPNSSRTSILLALAVAVVIAGLVVGVIVMNGMNKKDPTPTVANPTPAATAAPVKAKIKISSYDPVGGSGFEDKGSTWETQTYKGPKYAGLKKGIGLVLDLGSAKSITSVTFKADTGPQTVELHSLDALPSSGSEGKLVGDVVKADGKTKLDGAKGGKHQYWMIWVTDPGPSWKAVISDVSVLVPAS
jgi:hypothetical protein